MLKKGKMIKPIARWMKDKVMAAFCLIAISSTLFVHQTRADTIGDVTTIIANLTCETSEIGNMIHGEFGHTCVPMPFSTLAMAVILNPLAPLYLAGITTMNINNEKLFPQNCSRASRADFSTPKIRFSFCNDILLKLLLNVAVVEASVKVAAAVITGTNVWDAIKEALTLDPTLYNLGPGQPVPDLVSAIGDGYGVGYIGVAMAGYLPIPVSVVKDNDRICVATTGITGWLSMGCKYISEPVRQSQYASFMQGGTADAYTQCSGMGSCYTDANQNSKAMLTISGPLIGCIRAMIQKFLMDPTVCSADGTSTSLPSTFFQFQLNMQRTVTALLTIYIILFGFKLALGASDIKQADIIMFFVKFILVVYFSVGINMRSVSNPNGQQGFDGMTQWAFPIMLDGASQLAGWVMNASPSGLCQFTTNTVNTPGGSSVAVQDASGNIEFVAPGNVDGRPIVGKTNTQLSISGGTASSISSYASGYEWLALWDALDCRVSHYVGLDSIGDATSAANQNDPTKSDAFNFSIPPYFFLLVPAIISGNVPLAMLAISYPILIISVAAYVINAFVVCMIAIVVLGVLAPIFVPFSLFSFTKGYFDSWVKLLLSFVLQPMVVATFMITLFTIYDAGFYGTCKYARFDVPQVYAGSQTITKSIFVINSDPGAYEIDESQGIDDWKSCQKTLGYMINAPFAVVGNSASLATSIGSTVSLGQSYDNLSAKYPILSAVTDEVGLFFTSPTLAFQAIKDFIMSLLTACFCLYLMYQMSSQISEFAVDMVEGVSIGGMAIKPRAIMGKVQAGAQKLEDKLNERKVKPEEKGEGDKSKPKSEDSAAGGKGARKAIDTGGGGGKLPPQ